MEWIYGALIVVGIVIVALMVYSCCAIAGDADKRAEKVNSQHQIGVLSDLESQTLERLLKAFEEDGVGFMLNDGKVVDYEIEE